MALLRLAIACRAPRRRQTAASFGYWLPASDNGCLPRLTAAYCAVVSNMPENAPGNATDAAGRERDRVMGALLFQMVQNRCAHAKLTRKQGVCNVQGMSHAGSRGFSELERISRRLRRKNVRDDKCVCALPGRMTCEGARPRHPPQRMACTYTQGRSHTPATPLP